MSLAFGALFALALLALQLVRLFGIPAVGITGSIAEQSRHALARLDTIATLEKTMVADWLQDLRRSAMTLSASPMLASYVKVAAAAAGRGEAPATALRALPGYAPLTAELDQMLANYRGFAKIEIVDAASGRILAAVPATHELGQPMPWPGFLALALAPGYRETIDRLPSPTFRRNAEVVIARQILAQGSAKPAAVMVFHVALDSVLGPALSDGDVGLGRTGEILLVDEDAVFVVPPRHQLRSGDGKPFTPTYAVSRAADLGRKGGEGTVTDDVDYRGEAVMAAYRHVRISPEFGWALVVKQDRNEILAPSRADTLVFFAFGLALLLTVLLSTDRLARRLSRPIGSLIDASRQVAAGQLSARAAGAGDDELAELIDTFNHMAERIGGWHQTLEHMVAERTHALTEEIAVRRRAEADAGELLREKDALLDNAVVGICMVRDRVFIHCNRRMEEMFGWGPGEMERQSTEILYADRKSFEEAGAQAYPQLQALTAMEMEVHVCRRDKSPFWCLLSGRALNRDTPTRGSIWVFLDIEARKAAEAEAARLNAELETRVTQRTAELQAANEELESFAYSVSHDLRAPVRAIEGFGHMLVEDYGSVLDATAKSYIERIRGAAIHLEELIDAILKLSRSTRGDMVREPVDLSALAARIVARLAEADPNRKVAVEIQPGIVVDAAPHLVKVALENLFGNAWKYTRKTAAARIAMTVAEVGGVPEVTIRDNGAGFDMRYAKRLFAPFYRLHRAEEFEGEGIGLATVHRIVMRHGGHIHAEAEPGTGATFRFTLAPAKGQPNSAA